jgi:hypothetical protein
MYTCRHGPVNQHSTNNIVSNSYAGTAAYYQYYWLAASCGESCMLCDGDIYPAHSSSARDVFQPAWGIISPDNTK